MTSNKDRHEPLSAYRQYMSQALYVSPLAVEEEANLLRQMQSDHEKRQACDRLVEGYQPLIVSLARQFERRCRVMELLDLVQEGNIGLLQALENYDDCRGDASFRTFAFSWIRGCMLSAFWQYERAVRIPDRKARNIRWMNEVSARLLSEFHREPTVVEIAQEMGIEKHDVMELMVLQDQEVLSLHMPLEDGEDTRLEDVIEDPNAAAFMENEFSFVNDALAQLSEPERKVLRLRYGFEDGRAYTLREIAGVLGVALTTVNAFDRSAKKKVRKALEGVVA